MKDLYVSFFHSHFCKYRILLLGIFLLKGLVLAESFLSDYRPTLLEGDV